jgi:N-acetylneuraminate lyase
MAPTSDPRAFTGLIAAAHSPFDASGELTLDVVPLQAEHLCRTGVRGVFVAGTTGEFSSMTADERERLLEAWVACAGDLMVIAHVGDNSLHVARRLAAHAQEHGAAAIGALPPCYLKPPGVQEIVESCAFIAKGAPGLPFYYYDVPALTGVNVRTADVLDGAREVITNWGGVKYTNADLMGMQECLGRGHHTLHGYDETFLAGLALGATGGVGSTYNFAAPIYLRLMDAWNAGDFATARKEQLRSIQVVRTLERHQFLGAAKSVMGMLGIDCGPTRLPAHRHTAAEIASLRSDLQAIGFFDWVGADA